jgi:hypothetical protein
MKTMRAFLIGTFAAIAIAVAAWAVLDGQGMTSAATYSGSNVRL